MAISKFAGGFVTQATGTAGTATSMSATGNDNAVCYSVSIVAKRGNLGTVWIGGSGVATAVNNGMEAGDVVNWFFDRRYINLSEMYFITDTTGEGVDIYGNSV